MKKSYIAFLVLFCLLLFGCSDSQEKNDAGMLTYDINKVPNELVVSPFTDDIGMFWRYEPSEKGDIVDFWQALDTKHWKEDASLKGTEASLGMNIDIVDRKDNSFSLFIPENNIAILSYANESEEVPVYDYTYYRIPEGTYESITQYIVDRFHEETTHLNIKDVSAFMKEMMLQQPVRVSCGNGYDNSAEYIYDDAPDIALSFYEALGDVASWQNIDADTFGDFPSRVEYISDVIITPNFGLKANVQAMIIFYQKDNGTYIKISRRDHGVYHGDSKEKLLYYYTEDDVNTRLIPAIESYAHNEKVTPLE